MPAGRQPESTPGPFRHKGPCGDRVRCFRKSCRDRNRDYLTVELVAGRAIFYCHRANVPIDPLVLEMIQAAA